MSRLRDVPKGIMVTVRITADDRVGARAVKLSLSNSGLPFVVSGSGKLTHDSIIKASHTSSKTPRSFLLTVAHALVGQELVALGRSTPLGRLRARKAVSILPAIHDMLTLCSTKMISDSQAWPSLQGSNINDTSNLWLLLPTKLRLCSKLDTIHKRMRVV